MSLILDALKKLEREKQTTPRGFLVVAPGAWSGRGRGVSLVGGALLVGLVMGAVGLAAYGKMTQAAVPPSSTSAPPATAPAPAQPPATVLPVTVVPAPSRVRPRSAAAAPSDTPESETPTATGPVPEGPRLQAISEQDGHPVAVIDERVVREGDSIDGMKILRIGAAEVEIEHLGKRRILRF